MFTSKAVWRHAFGMGCAFLLAGCTESNSAVKNIGDTTCPEEDCGVNTSILNDLLFGENHLTPGQNDGNPNEYGAKVIDFVFVDPTIDALLLIADGTLEVDIGNGQLVSGQDILGSKLIVEDRRAVSQMMGQKLIEVYFHDMRLQETWTNTGAQVSQYIFAYKNTEGKLVSVCSGASNVDDPAAWAVLLTGEKYDLATRSVYDIEAGIFNIACSGTALYKMKMMGYEPRRPPNDVIVQDQRQATLKMIMADYCDSGKTFTKNGTTLQWLNSGGWSMNYVEQSNVVEAYWDKDGALCLDNPRLGAAVLDDVHADCAAKGKPLPSCQGFSGTYEWVTHIP